MINLEISSSFKRGKDIDVIMGDLVTDKQQQLRNQRPSSWWSGRHFLIIATLRLLKFC